MPKLSTTIQGIVLGGSGIIMFLGLQFFHIQIAQADVATFAAAFGTVVGGIVAIFGLAKKLLNAYGRNPV